MLSLILAILCSTLISTAMRLSEKHIKNNMAMFLSNYAICTVLSCFFMGDISLPSNESGLGLTLIQGIFSGFLYLMSLWLMERNMVHNGVVLTSAFSKLGVLVPTLMAILVFRESPQLMQLLGMGLALYAIGLIYFEKGAFALGKRKLLLLSTLLVSGASDSMANIFDKSGSALLKDHYLFFTFLSAFVFAFLLNLQQKGKISRKEIGFGLLIGIPNYFSSRFLLGALATLPAVIVYPVFSAATIVAISLVGVLFFKETVSKRKQFALLLVMAALIFLNL